MSTEELEPGHEPRPGRCGAVFKGRPPCKLPAGWGTDHVGVGRCRKHGGSTPSHERSAQLQQARRDVVLFAARRDVHPAEALLELVQWKAGEVDYWRQRVRELSEDDLTWGITRDKTGGDDRGITYEARPNVAYQMLREAERDLAMYCAAALKAGVDERRVRLAESQGALIASVLRRVLDRLGLTEGQLALVPVVVPEELRAIAAGEGGAA